MQPQAQAAATLAPPDKLSWAQWLWHEERIGLPLCLAVGAFMALAFGGRLLDNVIYSLCVGQSIQFSIEAGRHGISRWLQRHNPAATAAEQRWPGWAYMAPWVVICSLGGYALGMQLGDWITGQHHALAFFRGDLLLRGPILIITLAVSVMTTYFFYSRSRIATLRAQSEAAERAAAENQLRLLQSQLEPHMLFNTLANLRVLIGLDPERAQAMLDRLINFLRATLNASRLAAHPLATEFERIDDYLALMGVRMGARLQVELDLPTALRALPVPPLLLQPLVENAVKHGLEPQVQGGRITVAAALEGATLVLTVRDTGGGVHDTLANAGGSRFGLAQVRERLATLHGTRASLSLQPASDDGGGMVATIRLPLPASLPAFLPDSLPAPLPVPPTTA